MTDLEQIIAKHCSATDFKMAKELAKTIEQYVTKARIEENESYLKKDSWYTAQKRIAKLKKGVNYEPSSK